MSRRIVSVVMLTLLLVGVLMRVYDATVIDANTGAYVYEDPEFIYLGNDFLEIVLSKGDKGGIYSIIDKTSGEDFRKQKNVTCEIFSSPEVGTQLEATAFNFYTSIMTANLTLHLGWTGFSHDLDINANITVPHNSPLTFWRLSMLKRETSLNITSIAFPTIWGLAKVGSQSEDDFLVIPKFGGFLIGNPLESLGPISWVWGHQHYYPSGLQMQFLAFYDSAIAGLYLSTYDSEGYVKCFETFPLVEEECWVMRTVHLPTYEDWADFTISYPVVVGVFTGDWRTAANLYQDWAYSQWWVSESSSRETPEWMKRTPVWHTQWLSCFHFEEHTLETFLPFEEIPQIATQDTEFFGKPIAQFLWGWEQFGSGSWGNWLPPLEGWTSFDNMVRGIHAAGCRVGLFLGCMRYNLSLPDWEQYAIELPGETLLVEESYQSAIMCPSTAFWQAKLRECVLTLAQHGVDLIHFDEANWHVQPCVSEDHGHPEGYGNWWSEAFCQFFEEVRREVRMIHPEFALSIEGINELYIPFVDTFWTSQNIFEISFPGEVISADTQIIPLFDYVYHNCFPLRSHTPIGVYDGQMGCEFADVDIYCRKIMTYPFVIAGQSAGYVTAHDYPPNPWQNPAMPLLRKISDARFSYAYNFAVLGEPRKPPKIEFPTLTFCPSTSYPYPTINLSCALYSAWQTLDGSLGLLLTNIWNQTVPFDLNFNLSEYGLIDQSYAYSVRNGEYQQIGAVSGIFNSTFQIAPQEILLIAFSPGAEGKPDLWIGDCQMDTARFEQMQRLYANVSTSLNLTLLNTGPIDCGAFNVSFTAVWKHGNYTEHCEKKTAFGLELGGNATLQFNFTAFHTGDCTLHLSMDTDNDIVEMSETNNQLNFTMKVNHPYDVAITDIAATANIIGQGSPLNLVMTATNHGAFTETINVTAYANTTLISTENITLGSGNSGTLTFFWNTTGWAKGNYIISACAEPIPGETETTDNTYTDGWASLTIPGDVDGDSQVDIFDLVIVALAFSSTPTSPNWDPNADINGDNIVDIFDLVVVALHFAETEP